MKAWQVQRLGTPQEALELVDIDAPVPGAGEVLVDVLATPGNFPDVLMCAGQYQIKPDLPFTPGVETCGRVVALGEGVTEWTIGDRIIGSPVLPHGSFAEQAIMTAADAFPAPEALDDAQAGSLFIGYQTAWFALHRRAHLQPGEIVLVHAAAGGVGTAACQLAKAAGARVIGVVSSQSKAQVAREFGADEVIIRTQEDVIARVKELTGGHGADVIFDPVGGDAYDQSAKIVAFEGRIVLIGFAGGRIQAPPLNHALIKNYSILGLHWGYYKKMDPAPIAECHTELTRLADEGLVRPMISERFGLDEVAAALTRLGEGKTVGRVVYQPNS